MMEGAVGAVGAEGDMGAVAAYRCTQARTRRTVDSLTLPSSVEVML